MAPVWTTTAGKLATFAEDSTYSLQLEASTTPPSDITYSVIAGSLPSGMQVTSTGLLTGTPAQVAKRTLYTFVVRATAGTAITDRTFSLDIEGSDAPTFTTASGQLQLDDSTRVGLFWVLDGESVSKQIVATDVDTDTGRSLTYSLKSGTLPPGLTLSSSGLLSGIVKLTDDYFADSTRQLAMTFDFVVRVNDGTTYTDQSNSIFLYSADYWRVSNSNITVDMTQHNGFALTMDHSAQRRPVFLTGSDLGTFRHDNAVVIKIDVEDLDPLEPALEYSIQSGSLPTGLQIDSTSGEIYGQLPRQSEVESTYNFTIRANRVVTTGLNVFTDQAYTMKVIGEIDIGITFSTATAIGTLKAGIPSTLSIEAVAEEANRVLSYSVTSGSLPTGITLSEQGNLLGTIDASDFTDSTASYTFTVTASDQYQSAAASKEFTVSVEIPYNFVEYGNMTGHATSFIDQNIFYNIAQDPNINSVENIYRPEDSNFGMQLKPDMLMMSGLEAQTLTVFQQQMEQNHAPKKLYFSELKTAVAKEGTTTKYEVVYLEVKDNLVNADGNAVSSSIRLRENVVKPMLGPRAGTMNATADFTVYEVVTGGGLSFSTSGSKVRYANQLSADLGFIETVYPTAVANMRSRMKSLGHKEWEYLPLWMKTTQSGDLAPLGYVMAVPICYCKPGKSALVKKRIEDKQLEFKNISFIIDRYVVGTSKVVTNTFTADGTTTNFVVDELIHEEDVLVKEGSEKVFVGQGVTADNNISPTYLTADGTLRSADHELGITLSHDTDNKKTTITFTKEVPQAGTIIKVERSNDKYLKFRDKGI